jgi:hypothetical protein
MCKASILIAAVAVLGLTGTLQAQTAPAEQLPSPGVVMGTPATSATEPRYLTTLPSSPSTGSCAAGNCGGSDSQSKKSCLACLWGFVTYHRLPYTDINTFCCGCSGPARPPLYVYMLHPPAAKAPPLTLPDLSACGHCGKCGHDLAPGSSTCPTCGK